MTEHLGHVRNRCVVNGARNVHNCSRPKTALTEDAVEVGIEVPRGQAGTFDPHIVKKRQLARRRRAGMRHCPHGDLVRRSDPLGPMRELPPRVQQAHPG
jgi:hypothetical protein